MIPFLGKRRNIIIAVAALLLVVVALSSAPGEYKETIKNIIPGHTSNSDSTGLANTGHGHASPGDATRTSQFHYIVPASQANIQLCYQLTSSIVNRYPVPMVLGWQGTGLLDAKKTHLAKIRAIQRYMHKIDPKEDDDIIAIVDGYDIIMQLPPVVMLERYFDMADKADARLAQQFGITVAEARSLGIRQTSFWGPDKICWPINWKAARCWAIPSTDLPPKAFGPKSGNGEMYYNDPRWLNSGTLIGPVVDVRKIIDATIDEIEVTYDADFANSESDQYYIANILGRQEYYRSLAAAKGGTVSGGPSDREEPPLREADQETEYHMSIDYESTLFQTKAGYEPFFGYMQYNQTGLKAKMNKDMFSQGLDFKPYDIQMPPSVANSLAKLYDSVPEAHPGSDSNDWLSIVNLGTNFVTKHIYALWHCTGPKEPIDTEYPTFWFYPFVRHLLKAAVQASQSGEYISEQPIDGRHWVPKTWFPSAEEMNDEYGGAWTDKNGTSFVPWKELCGKYEDVLFGGEAGLQAVDEEEIALEKAGKIQKENNVKTDGDA